MEVFFCSLYSNAQTLVPYRIKDKWGLSDADKKIKVNCEYDSIVNFGNRFYNRDDFYCYKNGLVGLIISYEVEGKSSFKFINAIYDSIIYNAGFQLAYKKDEIAVYNNNCELLFPLNKNIDRNKIASVYIEFPKSKTSWGYNKKYIAKQNQFEKRKEKLIKENELQNKKDNSFAKYGEYLYLYGDDYYRLIYLTIDKENRTPKMVKVILNNEIKKDIVEKIKNKSDKIISKKTTNSTNTNRYKWYDSISIYPSYNKNTNIAYDNVVRTDYSPGKLTKPYNWSKNSNVNYVPSNNATLQFIKNIYPAYSILIDSGKVGLAYASREYNNGWVCSVAYPPTFDSLIATQEGFAASTTHIPSFYFKKKDSIVVVCRGEIVAGPIKLSDKEEIKYIDRNVYLTHSYSEKTSLIKLFNNNILFNPAISNFTFDKIQLSNSGTDAVIIHNKDLLCLYNILGKQGGHIFEKNFELPNATLISFKDGYYNNPSKYWGYLLVHSSEGKYIWFTKNNWRGNWQKVYEAEKLLLNYNGYYKIEKQGKVGYINDEGQAYFED